MSNDNTDVQYVVVSNDEGQYAIWPESNIIPTGWQAANMRGPKAACLNFISQTWTDMRPASLQRQMGQSHFAVSSHQ